MSLSLLERLIACLKDGDFYGANDLCDEDDTLLWLKIYYDNISTLHCCGDGCRVHAKQGSGFHCESCFGELAYDDWVFIEKKTDMWDENGQPTIINCHGHKCRNDGSDGVYCESCFGEKYY